MSSGNGVGSTDYSPLQGITADHRRRFNATFDRAYNAMFDKAKEAYPFVKTPDFTTIIRASAQWIDAHLPAHDTGEIAKSGLETTATAFYGDGSSFIRDYRWIANPRCGEQLALLADALAVSVSMAESAVCLYEAASRGPGGARPVGSSVPEQLEPTIAAWSAELFGR